MVKIKYFISSLIMVMLFLSTSLSAAVSVPDAQGNALWYDLNDSLHTAHLVRPDDAQGYQYPTVVIPETITVGDKKYDVKSIGREAFKGSVQLKDITIPRTISKIGGHAFKGCLALNTVNYNANNCRTAYDRRQGKIYSAFEDCQSITKINFGNDVTFLPEYLFWGCTGVTEITIPENVVHISGSAFRDCSSLSTLNFNAIKCVTMSSGILPAFVNCPITVVKFGDYVTSIPAYAFFGLKGITSIVIPEQVQAIGGAAFRGCENLTTVEYKAIDCSVSHTIEGDNVLPPFNNPAITTVTIDDKVTRIPDYLFFGCHGLQNITLPSNISEIGAGAFFDCSSLTSITIPEGVEVIKGRAFAGCQNLSLVHFNAHNCTNMTTLEQDKLIPAFEKSSITQVVFGDEVQSIPDNAFAECSSLNTISIPATVKQIGYKAFFNCISLKSITIPEGVQQIGGLAFAGCEKLTSINFDAKNCQGVTKVEKDKILSAFQSLEALKTVNFGPEVTNIPDYIFAGCSGINKIVIPKKVRAIGGNAFVGCVALNTVVFNATKCDISYTNNEKRMRSAFSSESITNVSFGSNVRNIPEFIFSGCVRVANISLPDSLESIGQYAFEDCAGIKEITIPERVKNVKGGAFAGCVNLRDINFNAVNCESLVSLTDTSIIPAFASESVYRITLGSKVESLPDYAFYKCKEVEKITFNKTLKKIGKYAFAGLSSLTSLELPEQLTHMGGAAFKDCEQLASVKYNAISCEGAFGLSADSIIYPFDGENKIAEVIIGKKVLSIPEGMFYNSRRLTELVIPKKVEQLGAYAFGECPELKVLDFQAQKCENVSGLVGDSVRSAFYGCNKLYTITLHPKMAAIPDYMFQNCGGIKRITLPEGVTRIGNHAFHGCKSLASIRFPESVTAIGEGAFVGTAIKKVSISEYVTEIGEGAFSFCPYLTTIMVRKKNPDFFMSRTGMLYSSDSTRLIAVSMSKIVGKVVVEKNVTSIDAYAFYGCKAMTEIVLPETLTYIGKEAFYFCDGLKKVIVNAASMPETPSPIFTDYIKNAELYVTVGTEGQYLKTDNWRGFKKTAGNYFDKKKFK